MAMEQLEQNRLRINEVEHDDLSEPRDEPVRSTFADGQVSPVIRPAPAPVISTVLGGSWSPVYDWPLVAVHAALLPNGKVLAWDATPDDADDDPHTTENYTTRVTLWDPTDNSHVSTYNDTDTDLFCAGSAHLWDGRILFAGGDGGRAGTNGPLANSNIYDPSSNTWRRTENMQAPRWYSSVAALSNGEMLTFGGTYEPTPVAEVFRFDQTWRGLAFTTPFDFGGDYQWLQAAPDGSVISFGPQNLLSSINTEGLGEFTPHNTRDDVELRDYGSYAMYDIGKILVAGGGNSINTAVVIDTATQSSSDTGALNVGRRQHNLTILADGSVLVTGGNTDGSQYVNIDAPTYEVELWDPATGQFSLLNPMGTMRQYHSVALLLPDGRVLSAGGGICGECYAAGYEERNADIFTPPYLYAADGELAVRPVLQNVPAEADYGSRFVVRSVDAGRIQRAHLIKLGSTTHSENQDQRFVPLSFRSQGNELEFDLPLLREVAPPGHYLLFAVDVEGVPSTGAMIKLGQPLVSPGEAVVSTLESGSWDSYLIPAGAGELTVSVDASEAVELYVSRDIPTRGDSLESAVCRAAAGGLMRQSCSVNADSDTRWYATVHGGRRAEYRLESSGQLATSIPPAVLPEATLPAGSDVAGNSGSNSPSRQNDGSGTVNVSTGGAFSIGFLALISILLPLLRRQTLRLRFMRVKNFLQTAAYKHRDADVRLSWLQAIDAPVSDETATIIDDLALRDESSMVRRAAIAHVVSPETLLELLKIDSDQSILDATDERLGDLLENDGLDDAALSQLMQTHGKRIAHMLTIRCKLPVHREQALKLIEDEAALVSVVQQSRYHDTRQQAADRLTHHDSMRAGLSACRSRDKVVAKSLQTRLDAEAAAEADRIATRHAVTTALGGMRSLADSVWSPQHGGRHQALLARWQSFDTADTANETAEFEKLAELVAKTVEQHEAEASKKAADEAVKSDVNAQSSNALRSNSGSNTDTQALHSEADAAAQTAAQTAVNSTANDTANSRTGGVADSGGSTEAPAESKPAVAPFLQEWKDDPAVQTLMSQLQSVSLPELPAAIETLSADASLQEAVLFDPPFDDLKARPSALKQRIKRLNALLDTSTTLGGMPQTSLAYLLELKTHQELLERRLDKAKQDSADRVKATHRQFAALSGMVSDGKWGPASSMLRRLQKKMSAMEPAERSGLADKLERAEKQVSEMADWQDFASRPKLEALCDSMEGLPAKELSPGALAGEVRELQAQWKSMGPSRAANELWSRFKTAGDTAYEPCKVWFEQKQTERKEKLAAKASVCESLESLVPQLDEESPDWKAIARKLVDARREWSKNRVHGRKPDKNLETRFSKALKPLEDALTLQYDANAAQKQALIAKAEALAQAEITQHSANQARSLQSAWKQVGVMRRKEDQTLWEVFNEHCRVIFKQRHDADREKRNAALGHVFRAKDIIKRLRQLSKNGSAEEAEIQSLATEFQGLADFPERDRKFLQRDFRGAMDAVSRVQENASKRRGEAEYEERMRLLALCEQLELAVEDPTAAADTLRDDVLHAWEATQPDYEANENLRRDLLVRMEVAAGIDTPADDKMRRMTYQLANLQEGMTSGAVSDKATQLRELSDQWLAAPPVKLSVRDALNSRFLKATGR